ncbi:phosphoribosylanthranilate isomerase [Robiginitalea sp.]|uniref:phosphoribosylanthranilate isomerase n=1 Tax=Robiginitalea sp. TaxID=1902411 RepID=UPI003C7284C1
MKLKICGMKYNPTDVMHLGPDYLGFIFWEGTPRDFSGRQIPELPENTKAIGVFVDEPIENVLKIVRTYGLKGVQLHGQEAVEYCLELYQRIQKEAPEVILIKAFAIGPGFNFDRLKGYPGTCNFFLFDSRGKLPGGNGTLFDWEQLRDYPYETPYLLSGGIGEKDCDNLQRFFQTPQAERCVGIDVNSKFEIRPGEKDIPALKRFLNCRIWKEKHSIGK